LTLIDANLLARPRVGNVTKPPNYPSPAFSIAAVYPHRRHLAAKVRVFIDALARLFARRDWLRREGAPPPP
jgi:DNA-binding transcriptional LysR family regulator